MLCFVRRFGLCGGTVMMWCMGRVRLNVMFCLIALESLPFFGFVIDNIGFLLVGLMLKGNFPMNHQILLERINTNIWEATWADT